MVEARAALCPACRGLEVIEGCKYWGESEAVRSQLLRALLPSLTDLNLCNWDQSYDECFVSVGARQLKNLEITLFDSRVRPSVEMLESLPALETLSYGMTNLQSSKPEDLISAFNRGVAFQRLHVFHLWNCDIDDADWSHLLGALGGAACAPHLTSLALAKSLRPVSMAIFSDLLGENAFPMLTTLNICFNPIGDAGLEFLVQGLLMPACQTRLKKLDLFHVKIGDKGMAALASTVRAGRFKRMESCLLFHRNANVTDEGVCALAQAVEDTGTHGLSMLQRLEARVLQSVTALGIRALSSALIRNCPHVMLLDFTNFSYKKEDKEDLHDEIAEMVLAAGCQYRLEVKV